MKHNISILLSLAFSASCMASQYPVVTSITVEHVRSSSYTYHITQALLDVGPDADNLVTPLSAISLGHKHLATGQEDQFVAASSAQGSHTSDDVPMTISQLGKEAYQYQQNITSISHNGADPTGECVTYGYVTGQSSLSINGGTPWSQIHTPGGCLNVPPVDEWCKITTPEIILDHGSITLTDAENDSATAQMAVDCTSMTVVKFNLLSSSNYIYLDDNGEDDGKSTITVDDKALDTTIALPQGITTHQVKDYLSGVTKTGAHVGSSVLVMEPY